MLVSFTERAFRCKNNLLLTFILLRNTANVLIVDLTNHFSSNITKHSEVPGSPIRVLWVLSLIFSYCKLNLLGFGLFLRQHTYLHPDLFPSVFRWSPVLSGTPSIVSMRTGVSPSEFVAPLPPRRKPQVWNLWTVYAHIEHMLSALYSQTTLTPVPSFLIYLTELHCSQSL